MCGVMDFLMGGSSNAKKQTQFLFFEMKKIFGYLVL